MSIECDTIACDVYRARMFTLHWLASTKYGNTILLVESLVFSVEMAMRETRMEKMGKTHHGLNPQVISHLPNTICI